MRTKHIPPLIIIALSICAFVVLVALVTLVYS